jgi:hypothetical protein
MKTRIGHERTYVGSWAVRSCYASSDDSSWIAASFSLRAVITIAEWFLEW